MNKLFNPNNIKLTKYLFYTGKGGVGKTSIACATAVSLADNGKKVLLISTDPASNLQDVFEMELNNKKTQIETVPNLTVINLEPLKSAEEYRKSVIAPYKGKLPDVVIKNMEEQLSGSCTIEIAAFNEFSNFIADENIEKEYDYVIFDTAPTGHTLRMLQLPSAWSNFISESTHGASCLGQLSGLEERKEIYQKAVNTLADKEKTTLFIVSKPDSTPLIEAERASKELSDLKVNNQIMIINGVLQGFDDAISEGLYHKQQKAIASMPNELKDKETYIVPLRAYNITGIKNVKAFLKYEILDSSTEELETENMLSLHNVIDDIYKTNKKVIFTMGKGGVGKTTVACAIALGLANKGLKVHLTTTDPANHLNLLMKNCDLITISHIDEHEELKKYKEEVLSKVRKTMSPEDIDYVEEDLRSPCTQEIAVFRRFAELVEKADEEIVVIDTAPTGHTLLLLDSTQSYHKEIQRSQGDIPESVKKLLPRLKNPNETEVIIVTLAETTPVFEAMRLEDDLKRAGILSKWWVINSSLYKTGTTNKILKAKSSNEIKWINKVNSHSKGRFAVISWNPEEINEERLIEL